MDAQVRAEFDEIRGILLAMAERQNQMELREQQRWGREDQRWAQQEEQWAQQEAQWAQQEARWAQQEARWAKNDREWARIKERMDKNERSLEGVRKLLMFGAKEMVKMQQDTRELKRSLKAYLDYRKNGGGRRA